jgi:DNA-binding transcriptional MerR regulator
MDSLTTVEVARQVDVHPITLERWLSDEKKLGPKTVRVGGQVVRLWTKRDVDKLKRYKQTRRRGRKPKPKK